MNGTTRVLIVDDSAVVREVLSEILAAQPGIEVVGSAADPFDARDLIKRLKPDVLTLDVEMPRMDGITFLRNLMRLHPMPVVMLSSLTTRGAEVTLQALELGAVDFIAKPDLGGSDTALRRFEHELIAKVQTAAAARRQLLKQPAPKRQTVSTSQPDYQYRPGDLIVMGASTGGTEAVRAVLERLPASCPPVLVTQHIPPSFSDRFAQRLNQVCAMSVSEARDRERLEPGHAYIAPGGRHLDIRRQGAELYCRLTDSPPVNRHRPSVEVLFNSLSELSPRQLVAVMLTGMGNDGAHAMTRLHQSGVTTLVQDESSSLVWGMPGQVVKLGGASDVLPLAKIADACLQHFAQRARKG